MTTLIDHALKHEVHETLPLWIIRCFNSADPKKKAGGYDPVYCKISIRQRSHEELKCTFELNTAFKKTGGKKHIPRSIVTSAAWTSNCKSVSFGC